MKDLSKLYNVPALKSHYRDALEELRFDPDLYRDDDDRPAYIFETIVSSGAGQYAAKGFMEIYYEPEEYADRSPVENWDIENELEEVGEALEKLLGITSGSDHSIRVDFNSNDGAIDAWVVLDE